MLLMTPHTFPAIFIAMLLPATLVAADKRAMASKPNICILLADDLRADGLGVLGHPIVKTPHIDQLVENGIVFRQAYTLGSNSAAVCIPSRQMLLRGISYFRIKRLQGESGVPSLAETFRSAGYISMRSGKPKNGDLKFDENVDGENAEGNANQLIEFVRQHAGKKPLFLYMAGHEPHDPQYATDEFYKKYQSTDIALPVNFLPVHPFNNGEMTVRDEQTLPWPRTKANLTAKLARYYASTSYWDAQVGRIVDALKQAGQFDNTLFIVAGDNGLSLGEHGLIGKQNLYEFGGMHVPLIFAGPGISKGETKALAYLMDIYPTLCELTKIDIPAKLDGKSLVPVMTGKSRKVRDYMVNTYQECQRSIRDDRWKLIRYPLINKTQLFDLQADPHEMIDLADRPEHSERIEGLLAELKTEQRRLGDKTPLHVANPIDPAWSPEIGNNNAHKNKATK
jgi:arylsulfatase A-like enzyme